MSKIVGTTTVIVYSLINWYNILPDVYSSLSGTTIVIVYDVLADINKRAQVNEL